MIPLEADDDGAKSLEGFLQYMLEDERVDSEGRVLIARPDVAVLQKNLRDPQGRPFEIKALLKMLEECATEWGTRVRVMELPSNATVRGYTANPNTRWNGNPGSGGGGGASIFGFATMEGIKR